MSRTRIFQRAPRISITISYLLVCTTLCVTTGARAQDNQPFGITLERGVAVRMRDGVTLRADVYRPKAAGKFPVLLQRTPYNKDNAMPTGIDGAARGYVVVVEDVRGRYTSEGQWYPFKNETQDGYDTIEWAAALPYSDGRVGMFGGSYVGATQMLAAIGHPPHLAGICPEVTASNYYRNWTYQGGALEQWFDQSWTSALAPDTLDRFIRDTTNAKKGAETLPLADYPLFNLREPLSDTNTTRELAPYYVDWLSHPNYDSYWQQWAIDAHYKDIQVPALTIAAWYDIFQGGSLKNYIGMKTSAGNASAREKQRLLVIIGGHAGWGSKIGDRDFGPTAAEFNDETTMLDWYDYLFYGKQNEFATKNHVRIFVMGSNRWRDEDDWPLARAKQTAYYLHSSGNANSLNGGGSLSLTKPASERPDTYVYDPMNPAPTVGGPLCCDPNHIPAGPRDQRPVEQRPDVLVFSTPPLSEDTEVTGQITLQLFAKSSTVDTDFTAKLVDVWPDGHAQNLTEGILRASHRESFERSDRLTPGTEYPFTIDLWSTSNVFLKGHRIRVEISSSNFPRFDRNLNTGKDSSLGNQAIKATNVVYHDADHPSAILLPLVPQ